MGTYVRYHCSMVTDQLAAALDELLDLDPASLADGELHDAVVELGRQIVTAAGGVVRG